MLDIPDCLSFFGFLSQSFDLKFATPTFGDYNIASLSALSMRTRLNQFLFAVFTTRSDHFKGFFQFIVLGT